MVNIFNIVVIYGMEKRGRCYWLVDIGNRIYNISCFFCIIISLLLILNRKNKKIEISKNK